MSSGFVSGGTADAPIERDDAWLKAQQEIEANRRRKEEENLQDGGRTLYEVLQANKAAKEEAFQESIKLKNQFRNLDEDEVEFLDSVLESTRRKEEEVKKETDDQLDIFRRQQEEKDKELLEGAEEVEGKAGSPTAGESQSTWALNARKRKRAKDSDKAGLKGLKLRKSSSTGEVPVGLRASSTTDEPASTPTTISSYGKSVEAHNINTGNLAPQKASVKASASTSPPLSPPPHPSAEPPPRQATNLTSKPSDASGLGLSAYSSDEDE